MSFLNRRRSLARQGAFAKCIALAARPGRDSLLAMSGGGGETERHRNLKRRAVRWALVHDLRACASEVRLPRSAFRADVAACAASLARDTALGETAVFECKQARADLLRDTANEQATLARLREISARRQELERLVGAHLPNLRRGHSLFAECDDYDFESIRHDGLRAVRREEARLQAGLFGRTKFDRLRRYRGADRFYLVVARDVMEAHEAPAGWGVLVATGDDELELIRRPERCEATAGARLALLQAIALAGTRTCFAEVGLDWEELTKLRGQIVPD